MADFGVTVLVGFVDHIRKLAHLPVLAANRRAISILAGADADGLPIRVQFAAAPGREVGLFAAARSPDTALGGYRRPSYFITGETS